MSWLASDKARSGELRLDAGLVSIDVFLVLNEKVSNDVLVNTLDTLLTLIQSGRFGPHPRHLIVSLRHVLHESPSRCSSHFYA